MPFAPASLNCASAASDAHHGSNHRDNCANFLSGKSLPFLTGSYQTRGSEIYIHLQSYFRQCRILHDGDQVQTSQTCMTIPGGERDEPTTCARLIEQIRRNDQEIFACREALKDAQSRISELVYQNSQLMIQRDQGIAKLAAAKHRLKETISVRNEEVTNLQKELQDVRAGFAVPEVDRGS
jgi:hypothetical protein